MRLNSLLTGPGQNAGATVCLGSPPVTVKFNLPGTVPVLAWFPMSSHLPVPLHHVVLFKWYCPAIADWATAEKWLETG
jgi:hypothetical protein